MVRHQRIKTHSYTQVFDTFGFEKNGTISFFYYRFIHSLDDQDPAYFYLCTATQWHKYQDEKVTSKTYLNNLCHGSHPTTCELQRIRFSDPLLKNYTVQESNSYVI